MITQLQELTIFYLAPIIGSDYMTCVINIQREPFFKVPLFEGCKYFWQCRSMRYYVWKKRSNIIDPNHQRESEICPCKNHQTAKERKVMVM